MPARPHSAPPGGPRTRLSVEQVVAVDPPSSFRIAPDGRSVLFLAERAGAQQVLRMPLHGGYPQQLTASEHDCSDPQWSPDGTRVAFVAHEAIWMMDADGSRLTRLADDPAGCSVPRWAPDGERLAFCSRRRGWSQLWLIEVPRPGRGRPPATIPAPEPRRLTPGPYDNAAAVWSPDGQQLAFVSSRSADLMTSQLVLLDVARALSGDGTAERTVAGATSWACAPAWAPGGLALTYLDDRDGWFHVYRVTTGAGDADPTRLTAGDVEHGDPVGGDGYTPRIDPGGRNLACVRIHDGLVDLAVYPLDGGAPVTLNPFDGIWRIVGWVGEDRLAATCESDGRPPDLWLLPVPGIAGSAARPQQVTDSLPGALPAHRFVPSSRERFTARDGLAIEATVWRPPGTFGAGGRRRVPAVIQAHGGPTSQTYRGYQPFTQLLVQEGMAVVAPDFRGSTGYGRDFRWANRGEWGHADAEDVIDCARWAVTQPWCDGRLAVFGGSYGGYLALCVLTEEPELWRAGVDLYGDSEIAESYRHGDRVGRLDLDRMMGSPDDPAMAPLYRRGSPVYRAERLQAPLLMLHGRRDRRVVPLMTERMDEALTIEDKYHVVHWYDEEEHGWKRRENRRDAYRRILDFLRRHLLDIDLERSAPPH